MSKGAGETDTSLIDQAGVTESLELAPSTENAWIEVIQKMDSVYADLVHYQVELEQKNSELEEAQQFIGSVLSSMTDVLIVCDTEGRYPTGECRTVESDRDTGTRISPA